MDKNSVIQAIIGLITAGIIGAVGMLFSTIRNLEHEKDLLVVKMEQAEGELSDLWGKYNKALEDQVIFMQTYYQDRIEIEKKLCE